MSNRLFSAAGGRKAFAGFYASVLLTGMAFPLKADFQTYGFMLLGALGITVGAVAYEDTQKKRSES